MAGAIQNSDIGDRWRSVQMVENHDLVYKEREPRIAHLADGSNARPWYARSRSRVAMGLLLTAPGIPMLFMGQEFLEDKQWNDTPDPANLIWLHANMLNPATTLHHPKSGLYGRQNRKTAGSGIGR